MKLLERLGKLRHSVGLTKARLDLFLAMREIEREAETKEKTARKAEEIKARISRLSDGVEVYIRSK